MISAGFIARLGQVFLGRWGGVAAAIFYLYVPYNAVDLYVRGDLNELWAMAFFPTILWFGYKLVVRPTVNNSLKLGIVYVGIVLSHLGMALIMTPVMIVWILVWLILVGKGKFRKLTGYFFLSGLLSAGLSAFFILPVIFEQQFVHVETLTIGYFNFLAHFVYLNQLFLSRFWGYGASVFGPNDGLSFQIGVGHWFFGGVALLGSVLWWRHNRKGIVMLLFASTVFVLSAFMTHWRATPLWLAIPQLAYLQFPWRFLALVSGVVSLMAAATILLLKESLRPWFVVFVFFLNVVLYGAYFRPRGWFSDRTDAAQFSGLIWQREAAAGIFDYLPKWSKEPPGSPAMSDVVRTDNVAVKTLSKLSNSQIYSVENTANISQPLIVNTLFYPGWVATVNGQVTSVVVPKKEPLGLISLMVPPGRSVIDLRFTETPLRLASDITSLLTLIVLASYLLKLKSVRRR